MTLSTKPRSIVYIYIYRLGHPGFLSSTYLPRGGLPGVRLVTSSCVLTGQGLDGNTVKPYRKSPKYVNTRYLPQKTRITIPKIQRPSIPSAWARPLRLAVVLSGLHGLEAGLKTIIPGGPGILLRVVFSSSSEA